ncbi:hypothetical protein BRETT_001013 [Brettanomyces bruxellensis]|uniref:Man(5)GlcNAc(2)-PP-dolichol translocation protein RFT1 n=1 Tax=Dekkera bruxellensis TaxID=5007 RepID=A0A871RE43_DEKBR|nr:uncharacterized protein BRETT_001013 [Brettanomyces bruxellensis]QOU21292.1 hypothetical protein BRETT_001013 [Brettanomyces bruxellensis]
MVSTNIASAASTIMVGQVAIKLMTFTLNQFLFQYASATSIGLTQFIKFILGYTIFLCREPVRLSVPKICGSFSVKSVQQRRQLIANFSIIIAFALFAFVGLPIMAAQLMKNSDLTDSMLRPIILTVLIILAAIIELVSEPYYDINQYLNLNFSRRTKIESIATFGRCVIQLASTMLLSKYQKRVSFADSNFVYGFAFSQLGYAIIVSSCYLAKEQALVPRKVANHYFESSALGYFRSIFFQQIAKYFLSEGDKILVNYLLPVNIQGYYSLITDYGSLLARLLFMPIEEAVRISMTATFESHDVSASKRKEILKITVSSISRLYVYILTLLILFAPSSTSYIVQMLFKRFGSDETFIWCFKLYWCYVPFLAVNGIAEALFNSVFHSSKDADVYSKMMILNSIFFFVSTYISVHTFSLGLSGLIYSNMLNMLIRISFCVTKLSNYIEFNISNSYYYLPLLTISVFTMFIQHHLFNGFEARNFKDFLGNFGIGLIVLFLLIYRERSTLKSLIAKKMDRKTE